MLNVNSYVCTLAQMNVLIYYFSGKSFVFYFSYSVAEPINTKLKQIHKLKSI